jgi:hypothetical protein
MVDQGGDFFPKKVLSQPFRANSQSDAIDGGNRTTEEKDTSVGEKQRRTEKTCQQAATQTTSRVQGWHNVVYLKPNLY